MLRWVLTKVYDSLRHVFDIELQVVLCTPRCQLCHSVPVGRLIVVLTEPQDSGVVSKL